MRPFSINGELWPDLRDRSRQDRRAIAREAATVLLATILLIGCAAGPDTQTDGSNIPDGYPTVASTDFNGRFEITAATIDGAPSELNDPSVRLIEFDVVTGSATLEISCERRLGSFTFAADRRASITLTGGNVVDPCPATGVDDPIWALVDRIDRWESTGDGFRLVAPGGDDLILTRI